MDTAQEALQRAIREVGTATRLAELLGITVQAVGQWERCPAARAVDVEIATGGKVTRYELRPDIFRSPEAAA